MPFFMALESVALLFPVAVDAVPSVYVMVVAYCFKINQVNSNRGIFRAQ